MIAKRGLRSESGVATVEMAVFASFLCFMLAGIVDYSVMMQASVRVQAAANAGAEFGIRPGNEANYAGMQAAATAATGTGTSLTNFSVTATSLYTCTPGGGSVTSTTVCKAGTNTDAGTPIKYVVVNTSGTLPSIFTYPGMPKSLAVTGYSIMRVPWSE
jgi:Flp pilus assembly protein TadG